MQMRAYTAAALPYASRTELGPMQATDKSPSQMAPASTFRNGSRLPKLCRAWKWTNRRVHVVWLLGIRCCLAEWPGCIFTLTHHSSADSAEAHGPHPRDDSCQAAMSIMRVMACIEGEVAESGPAMLLSSRARMPSSPTPSVAIPAPAPRALRTMRS